MRKLIVIAALALLGCTSSSKYVEGTSVQLGAYIPWSGNLYGVEIISYVNGCVVRTPSNTCYEVQRSHTVTNNWMWGMLDSIETSDTKVTIKAQPSQADLK